MEIGKKSYESIVITNSANEVVAIVTDNEIVEHEGYKVILEPTKD